MKDAVSSDFKERSWRRCTGESETNAKCKKIHDRKYTIENENTKYKIEQAKYKERNWRCCTDENESKYKTQNTQYKIQREKLEALHR